MTNIGAAQRKAEQAEAELEAARKEVNRLSNLPEEPCDPDNNGLVWFQKYYRGDTPYTYAAVRADDLWWVTSPSVRHRGYSWAGLLDFIAASESRMPEIWVATEMTQVL